MAALTPLNKAQHAQFSLLKNAGVNHAATMHAMNLRVPELMQAATGYPVFFSRNPKSGEWLITAMCGIQEGENLFVEQGQWAAVYQPSLVQTFPFHMMQVPDKPQSFALGFDERANAVLETTADEAQPLFEQGEPSMVLRSIQKQLEADLQHQAQTHFFTQALAEQGLMKSLDIVVHYASGERRTLRGLYAIDEDALQALPEAVLGEWNRKGYLAPVYGQLMSLYQINSLIRRHNDRGHAAIARVSMEVAQTAP